ncbi:MAG TPA: serine hydrolase domain-containing protein [Steroidobacteraceae bacterium]|nr:serine hydrolase domain-containing protein [Steroidobacteraceae bacterium]
MPIKAPLEAVARNLLPIVRIQGEDARWTMAERLAHYGVPGVSVAVIEGGELAWAAGFGVRDQGGTVPVDADTMFMGASTSKPVTAFLVLQHVERGIVNLDVDINRYLKRWQVPENEFTRRFPVTLRTALSHSAGLTVNGWGCRPRGQPVATVFDVLEGRPISGQRAVVVDKTPGGTERYSGGGYVLAEILLEDLTGRSFADLAEEYIFQPLGMRHTTFANPLPERFHGNVASGHDATGKMHPGGWLVSPDGGAGGIFTTAQDYARFMIGTRDAFLGKKGAILRQDLARQMLMRQGAGQFGLGWRSVGDGATRRMNHGGSNDGYQSETNLYLDSGDGAAVFTNAVPGIVLENEILNGVADLQGWQDFMATPRKAQLVPASEHWRYVGEYRIVSGVEMPFVRVYVEDGVLKSAIETMRVSGMPMYIDEEGNLFNRFARFLSKVCYGVDGRARKLAAYEAEGAVVLSAERD